MNDPGAKDDRRDDGRDDGRRPGRRRMVLLLLLGGALTLAGIAAGAVFLIEIGAYNVAASTPHFKPSYWVLETAMRRSVQLRARHIAVPERFSAGQVLAGFCSFEAHCVACHGALTIGR